MKLGIISPRILIRRALSSFLASTGTALVVLEGNSISESLDEVKNSQADTIIFDAGGPRGFERLSQLNKLGPGFRVLVLMDNLESDSCARALKLGACGCLSTGEGPLVFQKALNAVSRGEHWQPQQTIYEAAKDCSEKKGPDGLTPREWEVMGLVANGCRNKEISNRLSISEETAKSHIKSIYRKLKIKGRRDAMFRYFEYVHRPINQSQPDVEGQTDQSSSIGPHKI